MTTDDAAAVGTLCDQLGYRASAADVATRIARLVDNPLDALFVADEQRTVLAWIHVRTTVALTSSPRAEIAGLVVDAGARQRGIGRALLQHAEAWARSAGLEAIRVRCEVSRADAHAFYQTTGYRAVKRQEVFDKRLNDVSIPRGVATAPEPAQ